MSFLMDSLAEPYFGLSRRREAELPLLTPLGAGIAPLVSQAQERKSLSKEVAAFLGQFAWDGKTLQKLLPALRLPFDEWWIEWDDGMRAELLDSIPGMDKPNGVLDRMPAQIGLYVVAREGSNGRAGTAVVCWRHQGVKFADISQLALVFDLNPTPDLGNVLEPVRSKKIPEEISRHFGIIDNPYRPASHPLFLATMAMSSHSLRKDVVTEVPFFLSLLAMPMLQEELEVVDCEPPAKLNKARQRRGKSPLLPYRRVTMRLSGQEAGTSDGPVDGRATPRAHFVRRHVKMLKSGPRWWRAHRRGKGEAVPRHVHVTM